LTPAPRALAASRSNRAIDGATHQFGDPRRNIWARPFLGISDDDQVEIIAILRRHVANALA